MKSPKEGINPPFTPDWKAYEHIVNAYEYFAEQHCAVVSKQQRERAPMRRPHLPANTNIKAFTNLRQRRARPTSNEAGTDPTCTSCVTMPYREIPSRDCVCTNDAKKRHGSVAI